MLSYLYLVPIIIIFCFIQLKTCNILVHIIIFKRKNNNTNETGIAGIFKYSCIQISYYKHKTNTDEGYNIHTKQQARSSNDALDNKFHFTIVVYWWCLYVVTFKILFNVVTIAKRKNRRTIYFCQGNIESFINWISYYLNEKTKKFDVYLILLKRKLKKKLKFQQT